MGLRVTLSNEELETLKACLDYCAERIDARLQCSTQSAPGVFALRLTRQKVARIRVKLNPPQESK